MFLVDGAYFLGGHPMAGKEISGIAAADAELFRARKYALMRKPEENTREPRDPRVTEFVALIKKLGAEPVWLDAEAHDRAAAIVSIFRSFSPSRSQVWCAIKPMRPDCL